MHTSMLIAEHETELEKKKIRMRTVLINKCDRCGGNHGARVVRPFESLTGWWFTICPFTQEPVYITGREVG